MPIRTVKVSAESRRLELTPSDWRRRVDQATLRARDAVERRDLDDLRAQFAELREWEPQRAYQVRCRLTEMALQVSGQLSDGVWIPLYLLVAEELLDALADEPREPLLLNYAGVLLYETQEVGGAEALFKAAAALEPELEHIDKNLREVRRRKQQPRRALRGALGARATALGVRARRVAAAATKPVTGMTLSLVMIVKDEEEMLPGCLEPIRDAVDEMIVVDTGSTDRTVEIAESFGARVVDFPWNGSFADARNASLEAATGDWVIYLDADEHLVPEDARLLRKLLGKTWREAFYLVETNYTGGDDSGSSVAHLALRMFRNRPQYRFEGRIHEQKTQSMPTYLPERFETTGIRMRHYGYLKSRISAKEKSRRNIELLEQEARETPSPFVDFNLGSEYIALGEFVQACAFFQRAWDQLHADGGWHQAGYSPMLAARLVQSQREAGLFDEARKTIDESLTHYPDNTELVLQAALCARAQGDLDEAATLASRCLEMGDPPAKYSATVGSGTYLALCLLAEVRQLQRRPVEAEALYEQSLDEHPDYIAPVLPLAASLLARGEEPAPVCARLAAERPSAGLLYATALYEGGRSEEAEASFREVVERQPANDAARIGIVETLLARKRYADAAREAAEIDPGSPLAAVAANARLFAHAVAGDAAALADTSGVPPWDAELYRAWAAAIAGETLPATLPGAAASTAFTALEALLRVIEIDAFATLHDLVQRLQIDSRERREALARMYLRRGFLDSAAEEWIAVAQSSPDARAYVGLAQVALARGFREDAKTFAVEALTLDPDNPHARRVCEVL